MTKPRSQLVSVSDTPYYHVVSRCVRRTFLCGKDEVTGNCYEYRRQWIEDRIRLLSTVFSVDILSYAVMSNHYHIVLKLNPQKTDHWSLDEVINRWLCLFKGPPIVQKYHKGKHLSEVEMKVVKDIAEKWKARLTDLSWFMKCLNEPIAKQANLEEGCRGHFWQSRFHSDALLTDESILTAMAYVDLNPIRAKMTHTPETSDHTSIKERLSPQFDLAKAITNNPDMNAQQLQKFSVKSLSKFEGALRQTKQDGILYSFDDYLTLVDTTGRIQRKGKRGFITESALPILERLSIDIDTWISNTQNFEQVYQKEFSWRALDRNRRCAA